MKQIFNKARPVLCDLIAFSFFLPAYHGYSGLRFIPLALSEAAAKNGVTTTDVLMVVVPLLLIPAIAIGVWGLFVLRMAVRRIYLALPLVLMVFFLALLFRSPGVATAGGLRGLQIGFYLMALSAFALPFTKTARRKGRRRSGRPVAKTVAQA